MQADTQTNSVLPQHRQVDEVPYQCPHILIRYFEFAHLPPNLQIISAAVYDLACKMDAILPYGSMEKDVGMRKLLEAKDCFVRANLPVK